MLLALHPTTANASRYTLMGDTGTPDWGFWQVVVGVVSIFVAILAIPGTIWATRLFDRREDQRRWRAAREMILRDVAVPLGEGAAPDIVTLGAVFRSAVRANDVRRADYSNLYEVIDELIRQISADPFLDHQRRVDLLQQVQGLADEARDGAVKQFLAEHLVKTGEFPGQEREVARLPRLASVAAGIAATTAVLIGITALGALLAQTFYDPPAGSLLDPRLGYLQGAVGLSLLVIATAVGWYGIQIWLISMRRARTRRKRIGPETESPEEAPIRHTERELRREQSAPGAATGNGMVGDGDQPAMTASRD